MFQRHAFLACASVLAVTLTFSAMAFAQEESIPKYEIGVGYSGLHTNSADSTLQRTGNGGAGYFEYNLNRTLGLVGDFGGYANTNTHDRLMTYMFGPRFNWRRGRLTPYAQFLFGGAYLWGGPTFSQTQNAFGAELRVFRQVPDFWVGTHFWHSCPWGYRGLSQQLKPQAFQGF